MGLPGLSDGEVSVNEKSPYPNAPDQFGAFKQPGFETPKHPLLSNGGVGSSMESPRSLWVDEKFGFEPNIGGIHYGYSL